MESKVHIYLKQLGFTPQWPFLAFFWPSKREGTTHVPTSSHIAAPSFLTFREKRTKVESNLQHQNMRWFL